VRGQAAALQEPLKSAKKALRGNASQGSNDGEILSAASALESAVNSFLSSHPESGSTK
jgi:hypothetical protein